MYYLSSNRKDISLALALKSFQLQRESEVNVESSHLLKTLLSTKWKEGEPQNLNEIVADIIALTVEDVVAYLSTSIVVESSKINLNEFQDLIGGNNE